MKICLEKMDSFARRHIGPNKAETQEMLKIIGEDTLESLIDETIPSGIRLEKPLNLQEPVSEYRFLEDLSKIAQRNMVFKSYIGLGYYDCITPGVIRRNVFENPGWYTQYTPYQAEISQGRLEALLNFQTMISELTKMEVANASLLDEGTAAAEAMTMLARLRGKSVIDRNANVFFVSERCFQQTIDVLKTRADALEIELMIGDNRGLEFNNRIFGAFVQYPDESGEVFDFSGFIESAHKSKASVVEESFKCRETVP